MPAPFRHNEEELAAAAVGSLPFARPILELADRVVHNMTDGGRIVCNGLHLRIEGDAMAHKMLDSLGGLQVLI